MKSYTNIEQSKKLANILPIESADFHFSANLSPKGYLEKPIWGNSEHADYSAFPCWSLAALIELMGECRMERTPLDQSGAFTHSFVDDYFNIRTYEEYDIVDAAVEMILKLYEQKLI